MRHPQQDRTPLSFLTSKDHLTAQLMGCISIGVDCSSRGPLASLGKIPWQGIEIHIPRKMFWPRILSRPKARSS